MIRHPVVGPLIFGFTTMATSLITYFFALILTGDWRAAVKWAIIADIVMIAHLVVCCLTAKRGNRDHE